MNLCLDIKADETFISLEFLHFQECLITEKMPFSNPPKIE